MKKLIQVLNDFEKQAPLYSNNNKLVSEANVGWHIMHSCLVITSITKAITASDPALYKKKFSWKAFLVLLLNKIPRGKAKAPSFTQPANEVSMEMVLQQIIEARKSVELLSTAENNKYFTHPIFGDLQLPTAIKFLYVHTYHHEKIIKDILQ
ncbi:MAG: hypothetical protein NWS87_06375 [Sediminibacterium sp.]|jgi:hypothetical protein|nr:hypothetical protein [Sediminibacterium sp.]